MQASQHLPAVQTMLEQAEAVLGYNLLKLCLEGPKEKLDDTVYSQPALYVAGLAAVERLREEDPAAVSKCSATAGQPSHTCRAAACRCLQYLLLPLPTLSVLSTGCSSTNAQFSCCAVLVWLVMPSEVTKNSVSLLLACLHHGHASMSSHGEHPRAGMWRHCAQSQRHVSPFCARF